MVTRVKISHASGRGVAERWRNQYQNASTGKWTRTASGDSETVYNALCALGHNPEPRAVADIIGNQSWSFLSCSACGDYVTRAVDFCCQYSDQVVLLCEPCVTDGAKALAATPTKAK